MPYSYHRFRGQDERISERMFYEKIVLYLLKHVNKALYREKGKREVLECT